MAIEQMITENQRLSILHNLKVMAGYSANNQMIQSGCKLYGVVMSTDVVKTQLAWLAEQGLVTTSVIGDYVNGTLTQRGLEAEEGLITVPGVKRATPKM